MKITNQIVFYSISIIILGLMLLFNFNDDINLLPLYIFIYTLFLGVSHKTQLRDEIVDISELNRDDYISFFSIISSGWTLYYLIKEDYIHATNIFHINILVYYICGVFLFGVIYYLLFSLLGYKSKNKSKILIENENKYTDIRIFLTETQLTDELNSLLEKEQYEEAIKVQDILNKKYQ